MYNPENRKIVVSMTSWPKRIEQVHETIKSIIDNTIKPDYIVINLSLVEFPNKENDLPRNLLDITKKEKTIILNFVDGNTRTFKKLIPTLQYFGDTIGKYYILTIDDDNLYNSGYIDFMIKALEQTTDGGSFCLYYSNVIGGRMIYKSEIFKNDLWEKLNDEIISYAIDDEYYSHYLSSHDVKMYYCDSLTPQLENLIITNKEIFPLHDEYNKDNRIAKAYSAIHKINFKKYKYSILTYNFGNYELLHEIEKPQEDVEYIYVTDNRNIKSNTWKVVYEDFPNIVDPFEKVCLVRYNCFKYCSTDICIRIDGSIAIIGSADKLIEDFNEGNYWFGICIHPVRNNFIEEYQTWIDCRGYDPNQAQRCVDALFISGYNEKYKFMLQQNIAIQRRCKVTEDIDRMTFALLKFLGDGNYIERIDQIITSFVIAKYFNSLKVMALSEQVVHSNVFKWCLHNTNDPIFTEYTPTYPYYNKGFLFNKEVELYKIKQ